ncbi:MAG TPA: Gfo/Idh/MocA family oxidoreductase [Verrucomicrobiales bacterium]|nr:Gfo/Idh/MocA family oxidoreductase [Verrucomicrobiales bacterium]
MTEVRMGIVGLGNMGRAHKNSISQGKILGLRLAAVCDVESMLVDIPEGVTPFTNSSEMIRSGLVDAVHVCTPHFFHASIGVEVLEAGLHLMVEKPLAAHKTDCERLIGAWTNRAQVFAAMFNQRTDPLYRKLKDLISSGELGEVRRAQWTVTDWFRTEEYYASGGWRATWKGEGGGVLLNQCPHNLDLFQWMFGMPRLVRGFCQFGRYHQIEVEDDVTAYFQYENGTTALFVTSTGEAPGVNRLEVAAENGLITVEDGKLRFRRNRMPMSRFRDESAASFAKPEVWEVEVPVDGEAGQHNAILQNFTNAILTGETLISPGEEGIHSVELANAILYSAWTDGTVELPLNGLAYAAELEKRIAASTFRKREPRRVGLASSDDFAKSF